MSNEMIGEQSNHTGIIRIPIGVARDKNKYLKILEGNLTFPASSNAKGIVIFAHGSGSSLLSQRNQYVAQLLNKDGLATMLVDLLTKEEEESDTKAQKIQNKIPGLVLNKFNINLLSSRLSNVTDWVLENNDTRDLTIGYFGSSTGAAAALKVLSERPDIVAAIVSRGGRPDLVSPPEILSGVKSPTLLIVGGNDKLVVDFNKKALNLLTNLQKKKLVVIPGATHLFEEPGALEEVARVASGWFRCYFQLKEHEK